MEAVYTQKHAAINYNHYSEYYQWMQDNKEQLLQLFNMGYWRAMMTPEEIEMRSHPNRSSSWIPNRILKIRKQLISTQLDYLFGKEGWLDSDWKIKVNCMNCKVSIERMGKYLTAISVEMERLQGKKGWHEISLEQFAVNLKKAIENTKKDYTQQEIEKAETYLPYRGGRKLMSNIKGFCPDCWDNILEPQLGWNDSINKW